MKDRILPIPKPLHELHGEKATVTNLLFVYGTGLIAAAVFVGCLLPLKLPLWKYMLSALLIMDIGSGVVANLSPSTNQYYQQHKKLRIPFLLLHVVHPFLFWVVFPDMLNFFLFMGFYTILSSLLVDHFKNCEFQQNLASSLVVIGILLTFLFNSDSLILYSLLPLFMIKLVLGFSVKRPDYRKDLGNALGNLTHQELGRLFPIVLTDYSDKWPGLYEAEAKLITNAFSSTEIIRIDHIGSTAIPGLKAKPTIDMLVQIAEQVDIQKLKDVFQSLGYLINARPENPPPHLTFAKGYTPQGFQGQAYHVHIRYPGDWDEIRFRDYLMQHKEVAKEYESLKSALAEKYPTDREAYTNAKSEWIEKINKLTRK